MAEIIGEFLHHNPYVWRDENVKSEFYVMRMKPPATEDEIPCLAMSKNFG